MHFCVPQVDDGRFKGVILINLSGKKKKRNEKALSWIQLDKHFYGIINQFECDVFFFCFIFIC